MFTKTAISLEPYQIETASLHLSLIRIPSRVSKLHCVMFNVIYNHMASCKSKTILLSKIIHCSFKILSVSSYAILLSQLDVAPSNFTEYYFRFRFRVRQVCDNLVQNCVTLSWFINDLNQAVASAKLSGV